MIDLRRKGGPGLYLMEALALLVSIPYQAAFSGAGRYPRPLWTSVRGDDARARLNQYLARGGCSGSLRAQGLEPVEAEARVASLSDAEIAQIAEPVG